MVADAEGNARRLPWDSTSLLVIVTYMNRQNPPHGDVAGERIVPRDVIPVLYEGSVKAGHWGRQNRNHTPKTRLLGPTPRS